MSTIIIDGKRVDLDAARILMDDELSDAIHGTVATDQEFADAYLDAHLAKYGVEFVVA